MNDESCGCNCRDCREQDVHSCNLDTCGYTKYRKKRKPEKPKPAKASKALDAHRGELNAKFRKIQDPATRRRLLEWQRFVDETAGLDAETRRVKREKKWAELFE